MEYKNFAYTRVVTAPSPATTGTTLEVTAGDGALFPAVPFNAVVWPVGEMPLSTNAEIVTVTDSTGDVLTIVRQKEETPARSIIVGDRVAATITAYTARTFRFLNAAIKTTTYTADDNDDLIICNSANDFTVTLMPATGSGRILNIKNINSGEITVDGNGSETIDGELNQSVIQDDNIQVCDYSTGLWVVI